MPTKKKTTARKPTAKKTTKPKTAKRPRAAKSSALDAAVKVLGEAKAPLTTKEMIESMQAKGYWKSPGGQTPDRTLYTVETMLPKSC